MLTTSRRLVDSLICRFGGGGPGAPPPPPKPPSVADAARMGMQAQSDAQRRRGFNSTVLTDGLGAPGATSAKKTLLGG